MKFKFSFLLLIGAALTAPRAAHADLGFWSARLVGVWRHPTDGSVYCFRSDATYSWNHAKPTTETVAGGSGYWKIVQPTAKESGGSQEGPVALLLKQRKLVFQEGKRRYTRNLKNEERLVVNTVVVNGVENKKLYLIDGVKWKRAK